MTSPNPPPRPGDGPEDLTSARSGLETGDVLPANEIQKEIPMVAIPAETAAVETETAAPAKKEKAPRVRKAAAPKAKEEKAPAASSKTGTAPKTKKEEKAIRKPQLRMLVVLSKLKRAISLRELAEKADVNYGGCTILIGSLNEQKRKENDARYFPSLVSLGLVKVEYHESNKSEGKQDVRYTISAKGKEAIQKTK